MIVQSLKYVKLFHTEVEYMRQEYFAASPEVLKGFLGYMETIKGRSANTVNEYYIDLRTFFRFLKLKRSLVPSNTPAAEISIDDVDISLLRTVTLNDLYEFMNYVRSEHSNSASTRARKTSSLRRFFGYLTDTMHLLETDPSKNLSTPKTPKTLPKYLSLEQSIDLLKSTGGEFGQRDFCMLVLLLNCGLRRAELAGINLKDIRDDNTLLVRGKGNKERVIFLNAACQNAIREYLKVRPTEGVADKEALFLSHTKHRISLQGVHYVVKGYLKANGLEDLSTHKLRHTAATLMYQQGGVDIRILKDILGHENLGTTEIYTHISTTQMQQAVASNPLSDLKIKPPKKEE